MNDAATYALTHGMSFTMGPESRRANDNATHDVIVTCREESERHSIWEALIKNNDDIKKNPEKDLSNFRISDDFPLEYKQKYGYFESIAYAAREEKNRTRIQIHGTELQLKIQKFGNKTWSIQERWTPSPPSSSSSSQASSNNALNTENVLLTNQREKIHYNSPKSQTLGFLF